jgi:hypothetical protein
MAFGDGGKVTAMEHNAAAGWPTQVIAPSFMLKNADGVPYDEFAISGADHWYTVGTQRVRATILPTGHFSQAGYARLGQAGRIGRWKASWTRPRTPRESIPWHSD